MNNSEIGLLIALIILLLICFFILGYMYAKIRMARIFSKMYRPPSNVRIRKINIKNQENFEKMMKDIFDEMEDDSEDNDNETRNNS